MNMKMEFSSEIEQAFKSYEEAKAAHNKANAGDFAMQLNGCQPKVTRRFNKLVKIIHQEGLEVTKTIGILSTR